jgi:hypothetical protein
MHAIKIHGCIGISNLFGIKISYHVFDIRVNTEISVVIVVGIPVA